MPLDMMLYWLYLKSFSGPTSILIYWGYEITDPIAQVHVLSPGMFYFYHSGYQLLHTESDRDI